jgi:hypothetical protein
LDILGALTQTGITQTAAGGKARAFCDIVGDQLGTMETNEFLNLGQTLIYYASADNLEFIGEIFGVCRLERGRAVSPWRHRDRSPGPRRFGARSPPAGKLCTTCPNSYIV